LKETKDYFEEVKEDIKLDKISDIADLNDEADELKQTEKGNSKLDKLNLKIDLDNIKGLKKEAKLEAKKKLKFIKDLEKLVIELEKEKGKASADMIDEFNEIFDKGIKEFSKDMGLTRADEKELIRDMKDELEDL
ncbi:hypothetical protein, partial [Clostridium chrysemydis]